MRAPAVALAVLALAGCESTQSKSARLERAAQQAKHEEGLKVAELAREIDVERTTVLQDANGAAAVIELRNRSKGSLVGLPIAVAVRDGDRQLYANDAPGLDLSLVRVPALGAGERLAWVNDQVTLSAPGGEAEARVGTGAKPGPTKLPQMTVSGLEVAGDASGDVSVAGEVRNESEVEQRKLVVFVVGRSGKRVVAAGRAVVEKLAPGASARFTAFPIGDPRGAELSAAAPPTAVTP